MSIKDIGLAILVAFIWGGNYVAMKFSAIELPGFLAASLRFFITALILLPFCQKARTSFKNLYFISLTSGAYIGLIYYSMYLGINTCLGIILMQLNVPFAIFIARFLLDEEFTKESLLGIFVAFLGMIFVVGAPDAVGNYGSVLIMLVAAFSCALFSVQSKQLSKISPINLIFWTHLIAAPHLLLVSYFLEDITFENFNNISTEFWFYILYSILFSCIMGIASRIYLLRKYPVYKVVSFNLLIPFFGMSSSIFFENQIPSWHIIVGGAIIMLGIVVSQSNFWKFGKQIYENN